MQAGNLEEANKIDAAIKALKKGASPAGTSVVGSKGKKKAKKRKAHIPRDAVKWNGHHYLLSNINSSHPEAKQRCESAGGHLVRIENAREQDFVARLASKGFQRDYWLDGKKDTDGVWRFSDGAKMSYFHWHSSCPNVKPNYLWLFLGWPESDFVWGNTPSGLQGRKHEIGFICEWDE